MYVGWWRGLREGCMSGGPRGRGRADGGGGVQREVTMGGGGGRIKLAIRGVRKRVRGRWSTHHLSQDSLGFRCCVGNCHYSGRCKRG